MCLGILCFDTSIASPGNDSAFFQQHSQHVYNSVFGLPAVAPRLVQTLEWQVSLEHSNQFAGGRVSNGEVLRLDGETSRLDIRYRHRISSCWQLGISVPFVSHTQGRFDRAIDDWHTFFGFPDANRDGTDFNSLDYHYVDSNGIEHGVSQPQSGIGDAQVSLQRSLGCIASANATKADATLRVGIKLPTGNPTELRGSGAFDVFADWQSPVWSNHKRWFGGLSLGILFNGQTDEFVRQEAVAIYGSVGVQFVAHQNLRLIAQLDGHSAFYRSRLRELGDPAFNLALGLRYLAGKEYTYELSISEDAAIDTTPDIVARLAMTYRPDQTSR